MTRLHEPLIVSLSIVVFIGLSQVGCQKRPKDISEIVRESKPSVVKVLAYNEGDTLIATGTGFFIAPNEIVTNRHVIEFATKAKIKVVSGAEYIVSYVLKSDENYDIVRLGVDVRGETIRPIVLSNAIPNEGDRIVVVGNPLGLESTASDGIVSSIGRTHGVPSLIQISAPISPGSSGSPVMNVYGNVIGIATLQMKEGQNVNFALPICFVDSLRDTLTIPFTEWITESLKARARRPESAKIRAARICEATEWLGKPGHSKDSWQLTRLRDLRYDRAGNLIEETKYLKSGSIEKRETVIFGDFGREIAHSEFDSTGALVYRDSIYYHDENTRVQFIYGKTNLLEDRWTQKREREGNRERTIDEIEAQKGSDSEIDTTDVVRDKLGNIVEERRRSWYGGVKPALSLRRTEYTYFYRDGKTKVQETERRYFGEDLSVDMVREFDQYERIIHEKDNSRSNLFSEEKWFRYDKYGNQIEELCHTRMLGGTTDKKVRTFDAFGNLKIEDRYFKMEDSDPTLEFMDRVAVAYKYYE